MTEIDDRINHAVYRARKIWATLGSDWVVSIRVGEDVFNYLKSLATKLDERGPLDRVRLFGFEVVWDVPDGDIQVRATLNI